MGRPEESPSPAGVLRSGQFLSPVVREARQENVLLAELWQPRGCRLPRHEHERAYVTVVLQGHYAEDSFAGRTELSRFVSIFNPAGISHTGLVGQAGMRLFTIECGPQFLRELDIRLPDRPVVDSGSGGMLWPGLRMFSAFKTQTADSLVLESNLIEMLGAIAGLKIRDTAAPAWFRRVKDRLRSQFRDNLRASDLAAEAGVHPVHLSRVFRMQERQTFGEYVQRLRVRAACRLLGDPDRSLAAIAGDCGFSDQSHLTRTFRKVVGATPGRFRREMANPSVIRRKNTGTPAPR